MILATYTEDELIAEARRRAQRELLAQMQAKRLRAMPIDTTGNLFDPTKAENPLFATPTPKGTDQ